MKNVSNSYRYSVFSCSVETVATELQVELIDLQADNAVKSSFEKKSLIEFYKSLNSPRKIQKSQRICKKNVCGVCIYIHKRANILKHED